MRNNLNKLQLLQLLQSNIWFNYFISIDKKLLNINLIKLSLIKFWYEIMNNIDNKNLAIINIVFSYKIIDTDNKVSKIDNNNIFKTNKIPTFKFYGYNLPLTIDITKWGTILSQDNNHYLIKRSNSELLYDITIEPLWNIIKILDSNNNIILTFKDISDINDKNSFTRIINNQKYFFKNGELILKILNKPTKKLIIIMIFIV